MINRKAYAKINLALDVTCRLPNGYHEVKMIMQTVDLYDELSFEAFDVSPLESEKRIILTGEVGDLQMDEDNLIFKAAKLLEDRFPAQKGVKIFLKKNIPVAAGMAGGSTDAAAAFHGINELFELGLSDEKLCELGVKIGADVPYCIMGGTMLAEGIGEKLSKLPDAPNMTLVIAKPEAGVSTKYVYEHLDALDNPEHPDVDAVLSALNANDAKAIAGNLGNILEQVTIPALPEVDRIKKILSEQGADGVLMSGSGPTVFSIFFDDEKAKKAAEILRDNSPAKFICVTNTKN